MRPADFPAYDQGALPATLTGAAGPAAKTSVPLISLHAWTFVEAAAPEPTVVKHENDTINHLDVLQ